MLILLLLLQAAPAAASGGLSPAAAQVADIIGAKPLLERYLALPPAQRIPPVGAISAEALSLRQQITELVLSTSLDVDAVIADIDNERAQINEVSAYLKSRQDRAQRTATLADIVVGTGLGIAANGMQLNASTAVPGDWVAVVTGTAAVFLQVLSIRQSHGRPPYGIAASADAPGMLAPLLLPQPSGPNPYPPDVWRYLNSVPAEHPLQVTWRQQLVNEWVKLKEVDLAATPKARRKLQIFTASLPRQSRLTAGELDTRSNMLQDVRGRVSYIKRGLSDIMRSLR